jgi:hypothetical protein
VGVLSEHSCQTRARTARIGGEVLLALPHLRTASAQTNSIGTR